MNETETPRTDEMREAYVNFQHGKYTVDVGDVFDFARKLERELTAARTEIDKWEQIACDKLSEVCRQIEKTRLVTEQRDEARRLAERYRDLSCDTLEEADETLLPWEITTTNEPEKQATEQEKRDQAEWEAEMKAHKIEQMHDFLGERNQENEEK